MPVAAPLKPARRNFFVHGVTSSGKIFRPSDWAERLGGVLAPYRPGGVLSGRDAHIGYSPLVQPVLIGGVKFVAVDARLREIEHMTVDFMLNFARDNDLQVYEACSLPESAPIALAESPRTGATQVLAAACGDNAELLSSLLSSLI